MSAKGIRWVERVWARATRKRHAERIARMDAKISAAIEAHACDVEHNGTLCGSPLDDDGLCEVHQ